MEAHTHTHTQDTHTLMTAHKLTGQNEVSFVDYYRKSRKVCVSQKTVIAIFEVLAQTFLSVEFSRGPAAASTMYISSLWNTI